MGTLIKIFLLLNLLSGTTFGAETHLGCYTEDVLDPVFSEVIYVDNTTTATICCSNCLRLANSRCGLTEMQNCHCSNTDVPVTVGNCGGLCSSDGSFCGDVDGALTDVYATGAAGIPNFTLTVAETPPSVLVTVDYTSVDEEFYIDFGDGTPVVIGSEVASGNYQKNFPYVLTMVPGNYTLTVAGTIPQTNLMYSQSYPFAPIEAIPSVDNVECPQLREPDIPYICNVSVTYRNGDHIYDAVFDDTNSIISMQIIGTMIKQIGIRVPKDNTEEADQTTSSTTSVIKLFQHTILKKSQLLALDYWPGDENSLSFEILVPTCPSGTQYCLAVRGCLVACPYDISNAAYNCDVFCSLEEKCCSAAATGATTPTWTPTLIYADPGGTVTTNKQFRLTTPLDLEPGSVLQVTGSLQRSAGLRTAGDTVDDVLTNWHHYVSMTVKELAQLAIEYKCTVLMQNVTLTLTDNDVPAVEWTGLPASTMCERNITDLAIDINQTETDAYNETLNLEDHYYVRATIPFDVIAVFSVAGPIRFDLNFTPPNTPETTIESLVDYPSLTGPHTFPISRTIHVEGTYELELSAYNSHNIVPQEITGEVSGPLTQQITIHALYAVTQTWTFAPSGDNVSPATFLVPQEVSAVIFEDTSGASFPTNATVSIDWGDGNPFQVLPFEDPGDGKPIFLYLYDTGGVYTIVANITNIVSEKVDIPPLTITIYEKILDFSITPMYFLKPTSTAPRSGFGRTGNQFPLDNNVSFFPVMTQGTVDSYTLVFTNNGTQIKHIIVPDKFNPTDFFNFQFSFETLLNLTVIATNAFEQVSFDLFIKIVNHLRGLQVYDYDVTKAGEEKTFLITCVSVGGGSCIAVDFGDGTDYLTFGTEETCKLDFAHAVYDPNIEIDIAVNVTHIYEENGMYNITVFGYNQVSHSGDMMMFPVTDLPCAPPKLTFHGQNLDYMSSSELLRGEDNFFLVTGVIDCEITQMTKKRWQIFTVNEATGMVEQAIPVMEIIPTWNKPEFVIPKAFLNYGYYKLVYTLTMHDPEKPILNTWIFQTQAEHYIYIGKSPLQPSLTLSYLSRVARGPDQFLLLKPAVYTIDPDYSDLKNYTVKWKCRTKGEVYPDPITEVEVYPVNPGGTGCFGHGPGILKLTSKDFYMMGRSFRAAGETYEIEAVVTKLERTGSAFIDLIVTAMNVPVPAVRCSADSLCRPSEDGIGVYINPNLRLGLLVECILACEETLTYEWKVLDMTDTPFSLSTSEAPFGVSGKEFVLSTSFFDNNPTLTEFKCQIEVTNMATPPTLGLSTYYVKINQPPGGGNCTINAFEGFTLIDTFILRCSKWQDPENKGIVFYVVRLLNPPDAPITLVETRHTPDPEIIIELVFPAGEFNLEVTIYDKWGAATILTLPKIKIKMISEDQFKEFDVASMLNALAGGGNVAMLNMVSLAWNSIVKSAYWLDVNNVDCTQYPDCQGEMEKRMIAINEITSKAVTALMDNANFLTLGSTEAASGTLASIMETTSNTPNQALTIDILTRNDIYDILEIMVEKIGAMPIGSPEELRKLVENVATIAAALVVGVEEVAGDQTANRIPPRDFKFADQMYYDTDIGYDIDMVIPDSLDSAKKHNIRDTTESNTILQMPRLERIMDKMSQYVVTKQVLGEKLDVETKNNMTVNNKIVARLSDKRHYAGKSYAEFPIGLCPLGNCSKSVALSMREWPTLTFQGTEMLNGGSRILEIDIYDRNGNSLNVKFNEDPILLSLYRTFGKRGNINGPSAEYVNAIQESKYRSIPIMYTKFIIDKEGAGVNIELTPEDPVDRMFIMIMKLRLPTLQNYTHYKLLKDILYNSDGVRDWFLSNDALDGMGTYYIGIGQFRSNVTQLQRVKPMDYETSLGWLENVTTNYYIRIYTTGCYSYNKPGKSWNGSGFVVTASDHEYARCTTNNVASFGSGMFVMPNTIDFSYVFANMGFTDNLTIYLTLIITSAIFIILFIWSRWQDRKDLKSIGAAPLPDNQLEDKYLYEVLVFTGNKREAQTDSVVQFILSGEFEDTDVRTLADNGRKILRKGGVDVFVMAVPRPLGPLNYLRIWHDNSGVGPNASWFLSYIVFRDIQTGDKFEFISNNWFAVEKNDGQIERVVIVAGKTDRNFGHMYHNMSNKSLSDGHLWFSIFMRPPRSRFTRCQRVGACAALLYLSMLASAMWYDTVPSQPTSGGFNIGPFSFSPEQIGVGMMANLIVFPPSFLIVLLFRRARPRVLRRSRIEEALKKASDATVQKKAGDSNRDRFNEDDNNRDSSQQHNGTSSSRTEDKEQYQRNLSDGKKKKKKKKFTLPWWFLYVAWLLVILCLAVSVFFLLMYGIMFGNEKATKWLTSLIVSFFSSVLFVQPIKVFLTAMFTSFLCKSIDLDEDDADEDEENPHLDKDDIWLYDGAKSKKLGYNKMDKELLEEMRRRRLKEIDMWDILKELAGYMVFIWILLILSYGQRDPNAYYLQKNFRNSFIHEGMEDGTDFTKVSNVDLLWYYLHHGFFTELRADVMYNGKAPYHLRGFLNDYANRIMGYGTIRQIRGKKNTCGIHYAMQNVTDHCSGFTTLISEENRDYCKGWAIPNPATKNTSDCKVSEYRYSTDTELKSLPYWGMSNWYGGGGYVIHLQGPTKNLLKKFEFLQQNYWIDEMTRAVMIEFSTYNSQVNLFGICTLLAEFTPGGGIRPYFRFDAIRLLQHHDNFGAFIIVCEVLFVLFTIYFTFHEFRLLYKQKKRYFDSYWSYAELSIIAVSYCSIAVYFSRAYETDKALKVFKETYGNGYIKMTYAATLDEIFGYMMAFLVFVGTIKFIKLLRFNKRVGILSATLHQCWDDLSGFLMAFCICFFSFVMMFYFLLSPFIKDFANFIGSLETSFSMMMGKFKFNEMKEASVVVPVMFFIFVICTSWVLINLLLTIILKAFEQVKDDIMKQPSEFEMVDFVFTQLKGLLGILSTTSYKPRQQNPPMETKMPTEDSRHRVNNLPEKVDEFLDHINKMYLGGTLDYKRKDAMKNSFMSKSVIGNELDQGT